jgi:hypothetical protein
MAQIPELIVRVRFPSPAPDLESSAQVPYSPCPASPRKTPVWIGGTCSMPYVANAWITASAASGPIGGLGMGRATPAAR